MTDTLETLTYRDREIDIVYDTDAVNPFEEWDGLLPIVANHDDELTEYGTGVSEPPDLTSSEISENLPALVHEYGSEINEVIAQRVMGEVKYLADEINEIIYHQWAYLNHSDQLEALCDLFNMKAGYKAITGSSSGNCQGDYAEILVVSTPEWRQEAGATGETSETDMQSAIGLWGDWAWGNVYGYQTDTDDSCYGFYGDDHEASGLMEHARGGIDYHISSSRKKHYAKVKNWIRNNVPLAIESQCLKALAYKGRTTETG